MDNRDNEKELRKYNISVDTHKNECYTVIVRLNRQERSHDL